MRARPSESVEAAHSAQLRYVNDQEPGIRRVRKGGGFAYINPAGKRVSDSDTLARIKSLAIPPAWNDVWICPFAGGHIQAVGRDARGRKQYRYHARWRQVRDEAKYGKMISFAESLPSIRKRVDADLAKSGLPRDKVLATVVKILEKTLIRVGNDEYARTNNSYGLTTLRDHHARIRGAKVKFEFRGKSGIDHQIDLADRRLARVIAQCQDLPGAELFQYLDDDGNTCDVGSGDVNDYLRRISREDFTAKDFRTWAGTVLAARALAAVEAVNSNAKRKKNIVRAIEAVAQQLGNTTAVCRKCYVHPAIIDAYMDGSLLKALSKPPARALRRRHSRFALLPEEQNVLSLLRRNPKATRRRAA